MKKFDFNRGWEFTFDQNIEEYVRYGFHKYSDASGPASRIYDYSNWERVDLPHDWSVALPIDYRANSFKGGRFNSRYHQAFNANERDGAEVYNVGWYRKQFELLPEYEGKRLFLEFEGIYRDAIVWVNGVYMLRHSSGYTGFRIDITDHLFWGELNSVAVRVDCDQAEGWWYEGSGIYRNVWLCESENTYVLPEKTAVVTDIGGNVRVKTAVRCECYDGYDGNVTATIKDIAGKIVAGAEKTALVGALDKAEIDFDLKVQNPTLWSVENPYLYTLEIGVGGDVYSTRIGIREVGFDKDKGFLLNGKPCKVRGACNHHDLGGVGVALTDNLNYYKIKRLKDMGLNAYRCSHNPPTPSLLDACDELGMLVMDETRLFGTSPEAIAQMTAVIERDRNHPSVFIWSLGNEEFSVQNKPISKRLMEKATRIAKKLDPTRSVTYAGNNGDNFDGANATAEVRGFNYIRNKGRINEGKSWLDCYHEDHPNQPIIGTENTSYVASRGDTVNDIGSGRIDSFGNVTMPWGTTPKGWVKFTETRDFIAGGFMWTGFDYRGEPNPFVFTNYSSSFGTIDLCGMEKPPFYYYKAWWTDQPVIKLASHWNFEEGEEARVAVMTNCESITLLVNGAVVAEQKVEKYDYPQFTLPFKRGVIEVVGVRDGKTYRDKMVTAGETASVSVEPELIGQTDRDISIYEIRAFDKDGNFCPLANEELSLEICGGKIIGVGNGDPSSIDPEQLMPEEKFTLINKFNCKNGLYSVPSAVYSGLKYRYEKIYKEEKTPTFEDDFRLVAEYKYALEPEKTTELTTTVTLSDDYEYIEFERLYGRVKVLVDGVEIGDTSRSYWGEATERPYRFYTDVSKGKHEIKVVAVTQEYEKWPIMGLVKIGKLIEPKYEVKLHYGKARVFVKGDVQQATLVAKIK